MPPRASSERWTELKDIIRDLYITRRWELEKVREYMKTQHIFDEP